MELPSELLGNIVNEGELYFFMSDWNCRPYSRVHQAS